MRMIINNRIFIFLLFIHFISVSVLYAGEIKDSESATHGFRAAQYRVVDTYQFPGFSLMQIKLPVLSIFSYILVSGNEGLLVDPGRDISFFLETIKKNNINLKGVYLTHSHADFVAGHMEMVNKLNCPVYQSKKSGVGYKIKPLKDGSILKIGKASIRFIDTPGHTPDGMCALVYGTKFKNRPEAILTGDVLFVGSVGRPDLMGGTASAAWLASSMYDSWTKKLSKLHDTVKVFPAHGAGSLCGAHLSDDPYSTIGREKRTNPYFKYKKRNEFIAALLEGLPEAPQYFKHNAAMNKNGPPLVNWNTAPEKINATSDLTNPEKYYVIDVSNARVYAKGHIPKSVNIGVRGRIETWVGIIVPWESNLVVTGNNNEVKETLYRLHRVGYKGKVVSMEDWKKKRLPLSKTPPISPARLYRLMRQGKAPVIVDVRLPKEWMALRIGTVLNLPLNELSDLSIQLDKNEPSVMVCNSAFRSSMAVGILERKGFTKAMSLEGGSQAWIKKGYPVYEAVSKHVARAKASHSKKGVKRYVNLPERISAAELKRLIMDLPDTFDLIDIRPAMLFNDYKIPGSRNVDIAEIIKNSKFLTGAGPLIITDRDGTLSMAVGGILSQKTKRPIKVLYGGVNAYWHEHDSNIVTKIVKPGMSPPASENFEPSGKESVTAPVMESEETEESEMEEEPEDSAGC